MVSRAGSVDWLCFPRFDAPAVFARILDPDAGHFAIRPAGEFQASRAYVDQTMALETTFGTATGTAVLTDAMAVGRNDRGHELGAGSPGVLLRRLACTDGELEVEVSYAPRPEYGLIHPILAPVPGGLAARLEDTLEGWRSWSAIHQTYEGPWRDLVHHSGRVLQALTFEPTGAIVAAPTTSLPETVGGERNWDYRYTWVRDASFAVYALLGLGFTAEAYSFLQWLNGRIQQASEDSAPLQIMYRVDGSPQLDEEILAHLEGYRGSGPVRIGNGAATQLQLDIYGEALDSVRLADSYGLQMSHDAWRH